MDDNALPSPDALPPDLGVAHFDLEGRITLVNGRFAQLTGRAPQALVGTSALEHVHPDDQARTAGAFRRLATEGAPFELEQHYRCRDGGAIRVSASVMAV